MQRNRETEKDGDRMIDEDRPTETENVRKLSEMKGFNLQKQNISPGEI